MSDEPETPARPRASRFREHTNTNSTIRPPPDELWKDIGIEQLIEQFNEENKAPPVLRRNVSNDSAVSNGSGASSAAAAPTLFKVSSEARAPGKREAKSVAVAVAPGAPAASEGPFGRFQRAFASVFGGVLGKRKAGNVDAEKDKSKQILDERKKAANAAYHEAKELGLLPTPKVFIRPTLAAKSHKCVADGTTPIRSPRTPTLYRTPSKKDLNKQKKLSKRVSDLEFKLASARKELQSVLHDGTVPPVPALPVVLPPTPTTSLSENETSPQEHTTTPAPEKHVGKITKKRKATTIDDSDYKPIPTDSDGDISMSAASEPEIERTIKRVKSSATRKNLKRQSTRLQKKLSRSSMNKDDEVVTVVPDGVSVPPIPAIPKNVKGKKVDVGDDGYGGLEHEMF